MAGGDSGGEKKHKPTAQKLREARKRGQVSQSQELTGAISLLTAGSAVMMLTPWTGRQLGQLWQALDYGIVHLSISGALQLSIASLSVVVQVSTLVLLASGISSILTARLQTGPIFSFESVMPKLEKLNIVNGFKRMFSLRSLVQLIIMCVKTFIIGLGVFLVIRSSFGDALKVAYGGQSAALAVVSKVLIAFLTWIGLAFLLIGLADLLYQRFQFLKDQMMTDQELKREMREQEGNPEQKHERRRLAQQPVPSEQFKYVQYSALVITGSADRAVALYYNPNQSPEPIVIVKGSADVGQEIVRRARSHGVPVQQNNWFTEKIYPVAAPDTPLPSHWAGVAVELIQKARQQA